MKGTFLAKKLISAALAAGMACTALGGWGTFTASAIIWLNGEKYEKVVEIAGCKYGIRGDEAILVEVDPGATDVVVHGAVVVNDHVVPVTAIAAKAFVARVGRWDSSALQSVDIPASVRSIGDEAFNQCEELTSVTFAPGSQLSEIGKGAFSVTALKEIEIPDSVEVIDVDTFALCTALLSVKFGVESRVWRIATCAFYQCMALSSITLPPSIQEIGQYAFDRCGNLSKLNFLGGGNVRMISALAFGLREDYPRILSEDPLVDGYLTRPFPPPRD